MSVEFTDGKVTVTVLSWQLGLRTQQSAEECLTQKLGANLRKNSYVFQ